MNTNASVKTRTSAPTASARLRRSVPFWILLAGSAGALAAGLALTLPRIDTMTAKLTDMTATGIEVYVGQAWITLGAALAGAGAIGLALALALAGAAALVPAPARTDDAAEEWTDEAPDQDAAPEGAGADEPAYADARA
ncbi:dinucleotide-utilizing enzyme [Microbacterium sp. MEC084]|uniref:dinucleotide-utilizing enzyme n=1 Tax=Microbacterium sp. MEC084 TaxID=1963027 RepID=UPI001070183C|nr:dinucleotide-utilizing enzyme [Microbacterium sp. MEC084]MCD1267476.1 dinucleotide-utilizing enzyme [Microbacterium sp. MEC084]